MHKIKLNYYLLYSICFLIGFLGIFMPFFIENRSFVLAGDGYNQFLPALFYIREHIHDFLNGSGWKIYDWKVGYGENLLYALNYYGFGNPFSILVCLFPKQYLPYGYSIIVMAKLYVAGLCCSYYLKKKEISDHIILTIAMLYIFSSSSISGSIKYPVFLDPFISFPLIIGGIEDCIKKKRVSLTLLMGAFFQALSGFYFLYIELVLAAIYYCIYFINLSMKDFIKNGCKCLGCILWGICLAGVIFFPTIIGYLNCSRIGNGNSTNLLVFDLEYVITMIKNLVIPDIGAVYTVPVMAVFLCMKGMTNLKQEKEKKIMLLLMLIGLCVPIFGSMLNGFSLVENERWSFAVIFFAGIIIADELQLHENNGNFNKCLLFCGIIIVVIDILIYLNIQNEFNYYKIIVCICYIIITILSAVFLINKKVFASTINVCCLVIFLNVIFNGLILNMSEDYGGKEQYNAYYSYQSIDDLLKKEFTNQVAEQFKENENFRIDAVQDNLNIALCTGTANCTAYFSVLNQNLYNFYCEYGLVPVAGTAKHLLKGLDNRAIMEDIFSVKYYWKNNMNFGENEIIENVNSCNFGLVYDKYFTQDDFNKMSMLEKQSALTQGVVLENEVIAQHVENVKCTEVIIPYETDYKENITARENFYFVKDGGKLVLELSENILPDSEYEMYIHIKHAELIQGTAKTNVPIISINGKNVMIPDKTYGYWTGETEVWSNTPINEENIVEIVFPYEGTYLLEEIEIYFYDVKEQELCLEKLNKNSFKNMKIDADSIEGIVEDGEEKVLALAIPYEKGWTATINGEDVQCIKVNNGLLGVKLETGRNEIHFSYHTPYDSVFTIITCISWIGLILYNIKMKNVKMGEK